MPVLRALRGMLARTGGWSIQTVHPWVACGDAPYVDGWRAETFASFGGGFVDADAVVFPHARIVGRCCRARRGFAIERIDEPVDAESGRPLSLLIDATARTEPRAMGGVDRAQARSAWTRWPAPAKLNLFLHIVGRRDDGYHLLQTVFQLLDWGDEVRLRVRDDGEIRRVDPLPGVPDDADLGVRAALALQRATGCRLGADIAIEKRVPIGGGLGGGSSDAATVLVALNALWGTGLDDDALADIAHGLGADVPVFVRGTSAWAEGVGERLTPLALPERWFVVVDPGVSVPTRELFQVPELTRNSPQLTIPLFVSGVADGQCVRARRARALSGGRGGARLARPARRGEAQRIGRRSVRGGCFARGGRRGRSADLPVGFRALGRPRRQRVAAAARMRLAEWPAGCGLSLPAGGR